MALRIALAWAVAVSTGPASSGPMLGNSVPEAIFGEMEVEVRSHPYIVSIRAHGAHYCAGCIVNENWIVTAAVCASLSASAYTVAAGLQDISSVHGAAQLRQVARVIQHQDYNPDTSKSDIAVLRLATPLVLSPDVQAVRIASSEFSPQHTLTAIGWDTPNENKGTPAKLKEAQVPLVTNYKCSLYYIVMAHIHPTMMCAGEDERHFCHADSGGPLVSRSEDGTKTLVGLTSFGVGCGGVRYPNVYTQVSSFSHWIAQNTIIQ